MLSTLNSKILLAILAALLALGSAVIYQRNQAEKAAAAAKAALILQEQQKAADDAKARDEAFRKQVEADRKRHNSAAAHEGKTWKSYLP